MTLDKILVTFGGLLLTAFVYWFFFGKKEEGQTGNEIIVDGGYKPAVIKVKTAQQIILQFLRKDANSCLEEIVFPDFKIKKYLPINEKVEIKIPASKKGEYEFHCGMNMFKGKLIIE